MKIRKLHSVTSVIHFVAFGFGSGLLPIMPGTYGTLVAVPFYLLMRHLPVGYYILVNIILTVLAVGVSHIVSQDLGERDPPQIVIDEMVGFWWTMLFAPAGGGWLYILAGFVSFRFFDIVKPWPIRWVDSRVGGGLGIVADDLVAAFLACVFLQGALFLFNNPL